MSSNQVHAADASISHLHPHDTSFSQFLNRPQPRNEGTSQLANRPAKALKWSLKKKLCVSLLILAPVIGIAIAVAVILLKRTGSSNNGPPSSVSLTGLVLDSDQNPLIDVKLIGHAGATTKSIKNGYFAIQASILNGNIILDASLPGYAPNRGTMEYKEGVRAYYMVLHLTKSTIMTLNNPSATSSQVSIDNLYGDTTNIIIPPLVGVSGPVYFEYAAIPPFAGPGDLKSEQPGNISGSSTMQSGGMYYFNLKDADNNPVPFPNQGITVQNGNAFSSPLPPSAAPDEPAWYKADLNVGRWQYSYTTAVGANAVAQSEGYWNYDRVYKTACAVGQIVSPSEESCAGTHVKALGPDGIYSHSSTGPGGEFCVEGAATVASTLTVAGGVSQTIIFSSTPGNCKDPINCMQLDPIKASSENECPKPPPSYESCEDALQPMIDCAQESYTTGFNACHNDLCGCQIYINFVSQCWTPFEQLCCQNRNVNFDFRNSKYDCSTAQDALQGLQTLLCS